MNHDQFENASGLTDEEIKMILRPNNVINSNDENFPSLSLNENGDIEITYASDKVILKRNSYFVVYKV